MTKAKEQAYTLEKAGFTGYLTADKIVSMSLQYSSTGKDRDGDGDIIRFSGSLTPGMIVNEGANGGLGNSYYGLFGATIYCYQDSCGITINCRPYENVADDVTSPNSFDGYRVTVVGYNSTYGQNITYTASGLAQWYSLKWYPSHCRGYFVIPPVYGWR